MYKIGVMGGRETVMGFKALGLDVFPVDSADEARHTLRRITSGESEYAILYLEENLAAELSHEIDRFKDSPTPAIILIPGRDGTLGLGQSALRSPSAAISCKFIKTTLLRRIRRAGRRQRRAGTLTERR